MFLLCNSSVRKIIYPPPDKVKGEKFSSLDFWDGLEFVPTIHPKAGRHIEQPDREKRIRIFHPGQYVAHKRLIESHSSTRLTSYVARNINRRA